MKLTQRLCDLLAETQTAGSYYARHSLIQHVFTELLPMPLPPYTNHGDKKCIWATAVMTYAQQLTTLRLLHDLAKQYIASVKSVKGNANFAVSFLHS